MRVVLSRKWFAPDASLYLVGIHDFPNSWKASLPKTATVVNEEEAPAPEPEEVAPAQAPKVAKAK